MSKSGLASTLTFMYTGHGHIRDWPPKRCAPGHTNPMEKEVSMMTRKEAYESRTQAYLVPLLKQYKFDLVDVEYVKEGGNWYLRAYIDKEGGITVDDCEAVSRSLGDWLDKEDFIEGSYIMEVSSPGLGRPLKKDKDFERSIGEEVEIRLYKPRDKQKEFIGILQKYDADTVTIESGEGHEEVFNRSDIALIRLAFDF